MESSGRDPRVFRAQLELVYRLSERSLIASFALSSFLLAFYVESDDRGHAVVWWLVVNLFAALRIGLGRRFLNNGFPEWRAEQWERALTVGTFAMGLTWGYFLFVLSPRWGHPAYPLTAFIAAGMPAVSLLSNAGLFSAYVGIVIPTVGAYALRLILWSDGTRFEVLGAIAALIYMAVLLRIGFTISRRIEDAFALRFQIEDLVERLKVKNAELAGEVSRREETERGLREATLAAESANAAKSQFLARMSHEIRTPLNGILGMTEILRQTPLSREQADQAGSIEEAGRSLLQVINDILDFSRVEAGRLTLQPTDFSIREAVDRSVALLQPRAAAKGLRLEVEISPEVPPLVNGDAGRLRQVLVNLVGNATKFTEKGEVRVRVFPRNANVDPLDVVFEVSDTGRGIPEEVQGRLFEPFAQIDESYAREYGGTGLGLAISRQLVELMNGVIGLRSSTGKGTTFWFTARFGPPREGRDAAAAPPLKAEDVKGSLRGHVLLADDNPVNRMITGEFLKLLGCTVEEASEGEEAVRRATEARFDLVLMDCEMPRMDGYRAAREIRRGENEAKRATVPIVAVTASALATDRDRALAAGMNDYLSKPFSLLDLYQVTRRFLPGS